MDAIQQKPIGDIHPDCPKESFELPWTTVFYTLLPLATSVMFQPVGSVLGTRPIARTYLRSFPIICVVDALFFLLDILTHVFASPSTIRSRSTWRVAISETTERRFKDAPKDSESISAFKAQDIVRWVLFVMGTHGAIIKLVAAKGIPWSQTWGSFYVFSFCVFELMIFVKRRSGSLSRPSSPSRRGATTSISTETGSLPKRFWLASFGSTFLLYFAVYDVLLENLRRLDDYEHNEVVHSCVLLIGLTGASFYIMGILLRPLAKRLIVARPDIGERLLILDKYQAARLRDLKLTDARKEVLRKAVPTKQLLPLYALVANFSISLLWYGVGYDPRHSQKATWSDKLG